MNNIIDHLSFLDHAEVIIISVCIANLQGLISSSFLMWTL